jgi:PAS domain
MPMPAAQPSVAAFRRSDASRTFEARWAATRLDALVPRRRELSLRPFAPLLRDMGLIEVHAGRTRIRVVGEGIRARVQSDITSRDWLEFLPPRFHDGLLGSMKLIFAHPCGLWQVMAAHYRRGFSQYLEVTALPVAAEHGPQQLLCLVLPHGGALKAPPPGSSVMSVDTAAAFEFLDIGAGSPAWPPD